MTADSEDTAPVVEEGAAATAGADTVGEGTAPSPESDRADDDKALREGIQEELERTLLGGRRRYDRYQAAEEAGVPLEQATRLWVAMGFAQGDDPDAVMYTRGDVQALRTISRLVEEGVISAEMEISVTRALGQSLSRLAEWQVGLMTSYIGTRLAEAVDKTPEGSELDVDVVRAEVGSVAKGLLPTIEALQSYVWRRHLAANAGRALVGPTEQISRQCLVVGFADIVGYTRLTRQLDIEELDRLIERFESCAMDVIAEGHGWVVKTVGDEVMFAVQEPAHAARIALELQERVIADDVLPGIRVGMAYGPVLVRFGDAFGSVVNIAARLTSVAKPDSVLLDSELAEALEEHAEQFRLRSMRPVRVRGLSRLHPYLLRRQTAK
ncbi:adenylate/guanylate cyclase domain-containing protein [Rhodococcus sp. X156]|uniref:adenylate/guanylate cyclase domain-containing protein n=1 Tax=Rhodococcus sp. X156 TaxID=2499145 RepID=UPI001F49EE9B|nr:adenylate/guanylate cyclase domain-containing protein [Rhodococcus sp. X156]